MEVVNLDAPMLSELPPLETSSAGSGLELLMNDKKKSVSVGNAHLGELDNLEKELNELSGNTGESKPIDGFTSNMFGINTSSTNEIDIEPLDDIRPVDDIGLGQATADSGSGNTKTWDGFMKMNDIPTKEPLSINKGLSDREKRRKKRHMIKKMEEWQEKGSFKMSDRYDMDSNFEEVEDEYETAMDEKRKKDSVKLQGWWFMTMINSLEYANTVFNPFDLNLDGWGEQVSEDIDSYEDIFSELHEKYKGGKMAPEISLLLRVGFSAAVLNFSNKALSSATPAFNDVIKQSPELMKMFTDATVNSMSQDSPGFAMANQFMQDSARPKGPPPPAPVDTQSAPPPPKPGMVYTSNRADINASRGAMFKEQGVSLDKPVSIETQEKSTRSMRPEMKGPQNTDIDNILSGLKTRNVDIHSKPEISSNAPKESSQNDSLISVSSLKELNTKNMPKSSRKKNGSAKNIISLDI